MNNNQQNVTTQRTSKGLKAQLLLASVLFLITSCRVCSTFSSLADESTIADGFIISALLWIFSVVWFIAVKVLIWWKHA